MDAPSKILERIALLLDKSKSAQEIGSLHEAETFAKKAQQMLAEYNLSEFDVINNRPKNASAFEVTEMKHISYDDYNRPGRPGGYWPAMLMHVICINNFCKIVKYDRVKNMTVFGTKQNIDMCMYLYEYLDHTLPQLAIIHWKKQELVKNRYVYMRQFIDGAIAGLNEKFSSERCEAESKNVGMVGLVLFNKQAVDNFIAEKHKNLKEGKSRAIRATNAALDGYKTGKEININKGVNNGAHNITKTLK